MLNQTKMHGLTYMLLIPHSSAVTKVCNCLETWKQYLSWLPVYKDKEEAPHMYFKLIERSEIFETN